MIDEFLPWFSHNIPTHINAEFEFPSTFARAYNELQPKRKLAGYENFSGSDFSKFEQNFNSRRSFNK